MPPLLDVLDSTQIPVFSYVSSLLITSPQCLHFTASFRRRRTCLSSTTLLTRKQKAANLLKTLMFLLGSWAGDSSPERRSHRSSRFPSATHHSASLPPVTPSTQSYASLHSWRVAGITVCLSWERSVKENEEPLMFSPGWSHSDFVISVYLLLLIWPSQSLTLAKVGL